MDALATGYRFDSPEAALNWLLSEIVALEGYRGALNAAMSPLRLDVQGGRSAVRGLFNRFLVRHGAVLGELVALHRAGLLTDHQAHELHPRILATLTKIDVVLSR